MRFAPFLLSLSLCAPIWAQEIPLFSSGATVSTPLSSPNSKVRLQVRLGENGPILDDESANVVGNFAQKRLDAEPGIYSLQAVSSDKTRAPLGAKVSVQIPGFKREAGRWLLNGSMFFQAGENRGAAPFLGGLRRDKKGKLPLVVTSSAPLKWNLLQPDLSGAEPDFAARWKSKLSVQAGQQFVGVNYSASFGNSAIMPAPSVNREVEIARFKAFRAALDTVAPEAALVLKLERADLEPERAASLLDALAPLADAIQLSHQRGFSAEQTEARFEWLLKVARRAVEEQPDFDLPVLVSFAQTPTDAQILDFYQNGATGFIFPENIAPSPQIARILGSQTAFLSGAVTLEDAAIAPANSPKAANWSQILRASGRIPLLGRLPKSDEKISESLMIALESTTTNAEIDAISDATTRGATIYVEGAPPDTLLKRWGDLTGTVLEKIGPKNEELIFDDPWFWGRISGQSLSVSQTLKITIKQSLAAQAREERGKAVETQPRALAKLTGDPNGMIAAPVGKGKIVWMPHALSGAANAALTRDFYAAIAGNLGAALVSFQAETGDASRVSVRVRATNVAKESKIGATSLISFFNAGSAPVTLKVEARGAGEWVYDLASEKQISSDVRGFSSRFSLQIPANGWNYLAIAPTQAAWNQARQRVNWRAQLK